MLTDCLFCKIANKSLPATFVFEDEHVFAINDIAPKAPTHILIIPKQHIATVNDLAPEHDDLVAHCLRTATTLAKQQNIADAGYRLVFNCNQGGGQAVYHIHLHLLGGRTMTWPPG